MNHQPTGDSVLATAVMDRATRPRLLDLFCCAGGATRGYQAAGFYVVGVDIDPQPNYCGDEFIQADALSDTDGADERYGVHGDRYFRWQDRMALCEAGIRECARVLGGGFLLVKCQDQVVSGKIRWQTTRFAEVAEECGLGLVDRFDFLSYRPQPHGTRQVTARRCSSQLLVFKRGWTWRAERAIDKAAADG